MVRNHPVDDYAAVVDEHTQFIDVRQPEELATGTIEGAINVPLDQFAERVAELDPQRRVVLLCRSGNRSGRAAEYLVHVGFSDVINLVGGMVGYHGPTV